MNIYFSDTAANECVKTSCISFITILLSTHLNSSG